MQKLYQGEFSKEDVEKELNIYPLSGRLRTGCFILADSKFG